MNTQEAASTNDRVKDLIREVDDLLCKINGLPDHPIDMGAHYRDFVPTCNDDLLVAENNAMVQPLSLRAPSVAKSSDSAPADSASVQERCEKLRLDHDGLEQEWEGLEELFKDDDTREKTE
ncbi:hypothetical protein QQX98_004787 [Neonectria punicea]|uniref:Mediator of RNA polymerase II transcription subunit 21 n=1 Tax=Neonectria punicea TaxID=979145 RepID=A0ABR1H8F2_9HYPO